MDAKILRAAVSAAIRVTVSTTVIGCGANVTSGGGNAAGGDTSAAAGHASTTDGAGSSGVANPSPYPASSSSAAGGSANVAGNAASNAGTANSAGAAQGGSGGTEPSGSAGVANAANGGDGGEASSEPQLPCGPIEACLVHFDESAPPTPLSGVDTACCHTIVDGLADRSDPSFNACWVTLSSRFLQSPAHQACCSALDAWQVPACTPWGPPVPPELTESLLQAWEAAA